MSKESNSSKNNTIPELINPPIPHDPSTPYKGTNELSNDSKETIKEDMNVLQEYYKGKNFYIVMISLLLVLFVASLDIMIVATTIEKVAERFNDYSKTSWLVSGYSLPTAITCLITARFAYQFTVKLALILGVLLFELGSLISAVSTSMNMLIVGRAISGVGGSLIQNLVFVVVTQITPREKVSLWMAIIGMAFNISSVVGPIVGSAFSDAYEAGWRLCFYINLPIGLSAIVLFMFSYNHDQDNYFEEIAKMPKKLVNFVKGMFSLQNWKKAAKVLLFTYDLIEFASCSIGFVLLFVGLTYGSGELYNWQNYRIVLMLTLGSVFFVFSIIWDWKLFEKMCKKYNQPFTPLLDPVVYKKFGLILVNLCDFAACSGYLCIVIYLIQYYQLVLKQSVMDAGIRTIPMLISSSFMVISCSIFVKKTGRFKIPIMLGAILGTVGCGLLQLSDFKMHADKVIGLTILVGCGMGSQIQTTLIGSQYYIDSDLEDPVLMRKQVINITSFYSAVKLLAMATGSVVSNTFFNTRVYRKVKQNNNLMELHGMTTDEIVVYRLSHHGRIDELGRLLQSAIKGVYYIGLGCFVFNIICSLFITNHRCVYEGTNKDSKDKNAAESSSDEDLEKNPISE
ncbi:hypothetical protein ACO0R3_004045 [Hanseniaspora guilliermondii]